MARVLVVDDDRNLRDVVAYMLEEAGHRVTGASSAEEALASFEREHPDLVLTDVRMPGQDGFAVLDAVRPHGVPVVVLTAHGTVKQAVDAMQRGAFAYLLKPFEREELVVTVARALDDTRVRTENRELRELLRRRQDDAGLVLRSSAMQRILDDARRFAASDAPILITGESGTGKDLVARAIHRFSGRYDGPLVAVNCGAIAGDLAESELFGHVRGAFTGADRDHPGRIRTAAGGTLFLDEIADLPPPLQPKLLRVLDQRQVDPVGATGPIDVDFRLVSATNRDLAAAVRQGAFREDLYYRVAILQLHLPPLRERPEDVAPLWEHFTRLHGGERVVTTPALLATLAARRWPGNVRELRNLNQRLVVLRARDTLDQDDLARAEAVATATASSPAATPPSGKHLTLPELEREAVLRALDRCRGNKTQAARDLGIPRHVLLYRLKKLGL